MMPGSHALTEQGTSSRKRLSEHPGDCTLG